MDIAGKTTVNENVFQIITEIVLKNVDHVVAKEKKGPLAGFSQKLIERFAPQVTVRKEEPQEDGFGKVSFELKLAVVYGTKIPEAAVKVRDELVKTVEELTGYKVEQVDIVVDRIVEIKDLEEKAE
jgi:uncharacterized alkaline shock family protein YloU